jgi:hypothetical protein
MYLHIRKKKNKSGSISIQIVDRKNRKYKVIETIGCARNIMSPFVIALPLCKTFLTSYSLFYTKFEALPKKFFGIS